MPDWQVLLFCYITNNAEAQAAVRKPTGAWFYFKLINSEWAILSLKEFFFFFSAYSIGTKCARPGRGLTMKWPLRSEV